MRILLVYSSDDIFITPRPLLQHQEQLHFGLSHISSLLKSERHDVRLLVLSKILGRRNLDLVENCLRDFDPRLIGYTAVFSEFRFLNGIAGHVRRTRPGVYQVIGGAHASLEPEQVMHENFDALCVGEGELAMKELAACLERGESPAGIGNLWIRRGSDTEKNAVRSFIHDLDALPPVDRAMWQEWMAEQPPASCSVLLGRGCPYLCTYCCNHAFRDLASGDYVRHRSPQNIAAEIASVASAFPTIRFIHLEVETLASNRRWAMEVCEQIARFNATLDRPLKFGANVRITPNSSLDGLLQACSKANFEIINIGLESGSERVRRESLKRQYSNDEVLKTVDAIRKHGMKVAFFNMVGVPGETAEDFRQTVEVNRQCEPDLHYTSIFFPYPGTELHRICKEQGLIENDPDPAIERKKATLDLPGFSRRQIDSAYVWFDYRVFHGKRPAHRLLISALRKKAAALFYDNYWYKRVLGSTFLRRLRKFSTANQ